MAPRRRAVLGAAASGLSLLAGCPTGERGRSSDSRPEDGGPEDGGEDLTTATGGHTVSPRVDDGLVGYTHVRASGNRVLGGNGGLSGDEPVTVETDGRPTWLVVVPTDPGSDWLVATADGVVERFAVSDGAVTERRRVGELPGGTPPVGRREAARIDLLDPLEDASTYSHPVPVGDAGQLFVDADGGLVLVDGDDRQRAAVDALPDARPVAVGPGRYALLGGRTERYPHGALGDAVEAERVVLADVREGLSTRTVVDLDGPVVEGIAPIAADVTGDGIRNLLVTLADSQSGARLAAFTTEGDRVATGPGFSSGNRWRHQLCVAPFGPDGELEVAAVETPHIGGTARFYRRDGDELRSVTSRSGVSSHAYRSRNLDGGLAADVDGDGRPELVVPTDRRGELLALARTEDGVEVRRRFALGGELASNVTGVRNVDDSLTLGAAGSDGVVRVWGE
ncbi:hypothetical protein BRC79_07790 [Halobacteriales archaeon QH_8_67_27]|nr:MAG: hypothetical protein BRC79_07790 [Halobacteriales archaeon QH_8_67_27]